MMRPVRAVDHANVELVIVLQRLHREVSSDVRRLRLLVYKLHFVVLSVDALILHRPKHFKILQHHIFKLKRQNSSNIRELTWLSIILSITIVCALWSQTICQKSLIVALTGCCVIINSLKLWKPWIQVALM